VSPLRFACSNGHVVTIPKGSKAPAVCPVCIYGTPCTGTLRPIGPGSGHRAVAK
jgi:hypothetical protein